MATLDIFKQDAFKLTSMLQAIREVDYLPQRLGEMGIFTPNPVRTKTVAIEKRGETLALIQTSERGAPLDQRNTEKRDIRDFRTVRIAKGDRINADELADIRAFGTESELMQVQAEVLRRLSGPGGLEMDVELTLENMRLGAIQGIVKDADGSTIRNWFSEFSVSQPAEIDFDLDNSSPASGAVRKKCNQVITAMMKASKGAWIPGRTRVHAFCGEDFWNDLTAHQEVRETYLNTQEASDLRDGNVYEMFNYGGITWEQYRGTDDDTVGINADQAKFFPVNAPGAFLEVFSPGEQFVHIGQLGERIYPMIVPDRDRDMYADIEVYSYPLHVCTRPKMLQRAKRT